MQNIFTRDLSPQQQRFCREYVVDLNGKQAAIRAGYAEKSAAEEAARQLANVRVQDYINELERQKAGRLEVTADYVINLIKETVEKSREGKVVTDMFGNPITVTRKLEGDKTEKLYCLWKADHKNLLKGAELLGKHLKILTDRVEHSGLDGAPIVMDLTPETKKMVKDTIKELLNEF